MKHIKEVLLGVCLALCVYLALRPSPAKIGFIRTPQLLEAYKANQDAAKAMKQEKEALKIHLDSVMASFQDEIVAFEQERSRMNSEQMAKRQQELLTKQRQLGNYQESRRQSLQQQQETQQQAILNQVNAYLKVYGVEHGYDFIHGATLVGNLVYANDAYDLTKDIVEELNKAYGK